MLIAKNATAANGAAVTHHKISKIVLDGDLDTVEVFIDSWPTETDRTDGLQPVGRFFVTFPTSSIALGSGLLAGILAKVLADGSFLGGTETADTSLDLATVKVRKKAELFAARSAADNKKITWDGNEYRMDLWSRIRIQAAINQAIIAKFTDDTFTVILDTITGTGVTVSREELIGAGGFSEAWYTSNADVTTMYLADVAAVDAATTVEAVLTVEPNYEGDPE